MSVLPMKPMWKDGEIKKTLFDIDSKTGGVGEQFHLEQLLLCVFQ